MAERFRNMQLQDELDMYDDNTDLFVELPFLKRRSKIIEILVVKDIIFVMAHSGLGAAFNRITSKRISFLNISPDEVLQALFYNKRTDSLFTVSIYAHDSYSTLKCRTTPIEYIRRNQLDAGLPIFESESLKWPGFVACDVVNGKALTCSATDGDCIYKVFDLKNYSFLYSIPGENIKDIKMSDGTIILIYDRALSHVPLKILSIEDGKPLKSVKLWLHPNKKISFIEQYNGKLLVKQEEENLQIIDVWGSELIEVSGTKFTTHLEFIFPYGNNLFLTFQNRTVTVWNLRGELVTSCEDHLLCHRDCSTNNICITSYEDLIISYCKSKAVAEDGTVTPFGSINVSEMMTGKCVTKLSANNLSVVSRGNSNSSSKRSLVQRSVSEALEDVTALFYDEERNEIYTGNSKGLVHVWSKSNRPHSICAKL